MVNILDFDAVGDGVFLNTQCFRQAIARAKAQGGAVLVPPGVFLTGTIDLQGVSLYLEKGAVIKGSPTGRITRLCPFTITSWGTCKPLSSVWAGRTCLLKARGPLT